MREDPAKKSTGSAPPVAAVQEPHDEKVFFESFYRATVKGEPTDRMTIGGVSEMESRFHYNATENSILRAFTRVETVPAPGMARAWGELRRRRGLRLLDVGSGTGHWIDFFREVLFVTNVVGMEITEAMAQFLERKYAGDANVTILRDDIADPAFTPERLGGAMDYISAIGVMFHIVDDARWRRAIHNLAVVLKPGGLAFIGGDFGAQTRNVQFHRQDKFETWRQTAVTSDCEKVRVNKRVRSLAVWVEVALEAGLEIVDLVRTDRLPGLVTPENDILLLRRRAAA